MLRVMDGSQSRLLANAFGVSAATGLDFARDTRATTVVEAAVSAAVFL